MLERCFIRLLTQAFKLQARISTAVFATDFRILLSISCLQLGYSVLQQFLYLLLTDIGRNNHTREGEIKWEHIVNHCEIRVW